MPQKDNLTFLQLPEYLRSTYLQSKDGMYTINKKHHVTAVRRRKKSKETLIIHPCTNTYLENGDSHLNSTHKPTKGSANFNKPILPQPFSTLPKCITFSDLNRVLLFFPLQRRNRKGIFILTTPIIPYQLPHLLPTSKPNLFLI